LGEACDERIAVGKAADGLPLPFRVHDDGSEVRAPLAGLVAGLRIAAHELCLVVPVDTPFLSAAALARLAEACLDAAVPPTGPLPGAYRRAAALPVLEARLARGALSLRGALGELRVATVPLPAAELVNVNTPAELAAAYDAGHG
jgi:molybdenum cofactor guanylyltransferase